VAFIAAHERCFVVEQNRDAQLRTLLTVELGIDPARLWPALSYGGFPLSAREVIAHVDQRLEKEREKEREMEKATA
jgi:2-oxoglutarate/2-oxoacid ferredoxin oxidoreductase subunit alpha